jgi:hypothetical protein
MNKPALRDPEEYKVVANCGLVIPDEERRQSFIDLMDEADVWIFWSTFGHKLIVSDRQ